MPYFVVDRFAGGLDLRKPEWALPSGSASVAENVHLTRGGDWEVRKAFVQQYTLPPAQTVGLATVNNVPFVFGIVDRPTSLDAVFGYQKIVHPTDAGSAISKINSWDVYDGKLYLSVTFADGSTHHYYDGARVAAWADGRARASFDVTGTTGSVTSIKVNGIEILGSTVSWATSNSATATAIASTISAFASSPEFAATAINQTVNLIADQSVGDSQNGSIVVIAVSGGMTTSAPTPVANGQADVGSYVPGKTVLTHDAKMYALSGPRLHFSSVLTPVQWNPDYPGAGFVEISNHTSGAADLTGVGVYIADLALFTDTNIQIWDVAADDTQNTRKQTIQNYGTRSPKSVRPFGDTGLMFLDRKGLRALQPSSTLANYALVDEVGSQIDELLIPRMAAMSADTIANAISIVEPVDNRFLCFLSDRAYVLTRFTATRVYGWSEYILGFTADDACICNDRVWVRSGNTVYIYGGLTGDVYDSTVPRIRLANLSAGAPATFKDVTGFDFGVIGEWEVRQAYDLTESATERASILFEPTFDAPAVPTIGWQTNPTLEFIGRGSGYKRLVSVVIHFDRNLSE